MTQRTYGNMKLSATRALWKSEKVLHEYEVRYHSLFDNMLEGFAYCRMLFDGDLPVDFIYIEVNPVFEQLTGLKNVKGNRVSEVIPRIRALDPELFEIYGRVALTGKPERFEKYVNALKTWFYISVYSPKPEYFVAVFDVITERKLAQAKIQQQLNQLTALHAIDTAICSSIDLQVILNILLEHVVGQLKVDAATVLLWELPNQTLHYSNWIGFNADISKLGNPRLDEGYAGLLALEQREVYIPNVAEEPDCSRAKRLAQPEGFTAYYAVPLIASGNVKGILEIFQRTPLQLEQEWLNFLDMLTGQAVIAIDTSRLFQDLQQSNSELALAYDATIEGWSRALDLRDRETEGHTQRVTEMTVELARLFKLSELELINIRWGALLHDIGKMGVPDRILFKPASLTAEEWLLMKKHPTFAYEMLAPIQYLHAAIDIPYCHHEKWDGTGYPHGLKGEEIPIAARIFAVIDVYDALISDRPYRSAWTKEQAIEQIHADSGTHFDPYVVEVFLKFINNTD